MYNNAILDGYINLAGAIIRAAIEDYEKAIRTGNRAKKRSLEKWFHGDWCATLTFDKGPVILEQAQKELGIFKGGSGNDR